MKNNILKMILFFSLFLAMLSFIGYAAPTINNSWKSPDIATYSPGAEYRFNVTVCDAASNISTVLFEWNGEPNTTVTENISDVPNCYNFTINKMDLSANETGWNFIWYANNTANKNASLSDSYNISKASTAINLSLNDTQGNKNYNQYQIANFTAQSNVNGLTVNISTNIIGWTEPTETTTVYNTTNLTTLGTFNITGYTNGNENYTVSSQTYFFDVTDLKWSSNTSLGPSPTTYVTGGNYSFQINWTGNVSEVLFELNNADYTNVSSPTIQKNGNTYWINFTDLSTGNYNYSWLANDTNNIWSSSDLWNYSIIPIPITLSFSPNQAIVAPSGSVTFSCSNATPVANNLSLSLGESTDVACSGNYSFSCTVTAPSTENYYTYSCLIGNTNYSGNAYKTILVQNPSSITTFPNGATPTPTPTPTPNVTTPTPTPNQTVIAPSLGAGNENTTSNETQNATGEELLGPTGLVSVFEYMRNNLLIVVAMAVCVLIFIFRDDVNENLMRITERKGYKKYYKTVGLSLKNKLPDFEKIKNGVRDLKPEKPGIKRPESLEREIKRDIKELQNVIDTDKKLNKKKKFGIENN